MQRALTQELFAIKRDYESIANLYETVQRTSYSIADARNDLLILIKHGGLGGDVAGIRGYLQDAPIRVGLQAVIRMVNSSVSPDQYARMFN